MNFSDFFQHFFEIIIQYKVSIIIIIFAIIFEFLARRIKNNNKRKIFEKYGESIDQENNEFYLQFYQKNQIIDFFRVIGMIFFISILFVVHTDIGIGFFAVAVGAFVMAFKEVILSVIAFFLVTPRFEIGTTIKVAWAQWQIIFIRMLSVGILGRDSNGENTGELFLIPNYKFIHEVVEKEDLRTMSVMRDEIIVPYKSENFIVSFEDFMWELRPFLQWLFPILKANEVENFPSYTGHKYKINFSYHEDKFVAIHIRFVGKLEKNKEYKEKIIAFVDKFHKKS